MSNVPGYDALRDLFNCSAEGSDKAEIRNLVYGVEPIQGEDSFDWMYDEFELTPPMIT